MEIGTTARAQVSTDSDIAGNIEEQNQNCPSPTMHIATPTPTEIAAPQDIENLPTSCEAQRLEVSAEQVQADVTAVRMERDSVIGEVNEYKVRVHNRRRVQLVGVFRLRTLQALTETREGKRSP